MKSPVACFAALGLTLFLLSGCGASTSLPQTQAGDPAAQPDFPLLTDIPIPAGASMDNDRSLILGDRDRWTGRVVMKLNWKSASDITTFYQTQMPAFGWEPVMAATSGISVMSYIRGDRAATVQVEGGTMMGSRISVTVGPRAVSGGAGGGGMGGSGMGAGNSGMGGSGMSGNGSYEPSPRSSKIKSEPLPPLKH